jgi:hypothetical protein
VHGIRRSRLTSPGRRPCTSTSTASFTSGPDYRVKRFAHDALPVGSREHAESGELAFVGIERNFRAEEVTAEGVSQHLRQVMPDAVTRITCMLLRTAAGTPSTQWPNNTVWVNNAQVTYSRIGDIPDLDSLGQAIGSEYHGSLHGDVGGTMSSFYSPADPIFYGWHGLIDTLADVWLATPNGKAWAAAHPNHPFLTVGFTSHEGWDNADFVP